MKKNCSFIIWISGLYITCRVCSLYFSCKYIIFMHSVFIFTLILSLNSNQAPLISNLDFVPNFRCEPESSNRFKQHGPIRKSASVTNKNQNQHSLQPTIIFWIVKLKRAKYLLNSINKLKRKCNQNENQYRRKT